MSVHPPRPSSVRVPSSCWALAQQSRIDQNGLLFLKTHTDDGTTLEIGLTEGQKVPFGSHLQCWNSL